MYTVWLYEIKYDPLLLSPKWRAAFQEGQINLYQIGVKQI